MSRFSDTYTIRQAISTATLTLLMDSIMVVACGVILYLQNRKLFFAVLPIVFLYALRRAVAYVDQNTFLFSDTIKNNLKLGNPEASDAEIERACKISRADEFIGKLPLGYDTPLDENGMNLSGGQRQRLAIARALLKKPQLLILDEATSNLDTITEASIKNTISQVGGDTTCIIIAHSLTTVRNCDRIYVMEQGRITETGTHDELMEKGGLYAKLWNMQ